MNAGLIAKSCSEIGVHLNRNNTNLLMILTIKSRKTEIKNKELERLKEPAFSVSKVVFTIAKGKVEISVRIRAHVSSRNKRSEQ
jgi:hypothetical protein